MASAFNSKLAEQLSHAGLDVSYWAEILKTKLDVTCLQQLQYLDETDLDNLKGSLRQRWEEEGLRKLLGIKDEAISSRGAENDEVRNVAKFNDSGEYRVNDEMNTLVNKIATWYSGQLLPDKCVEYLQEILQVVDEAEAQTGTNKYWVDTLCNEQFCLGSFLCKVVKNVDRFGPKDEPMIMMIRFLIRKLISPVELKVFPGKSMIVEWAEMEKAMVVYNPSLPTTTEIKSVPDLIRHLKEKVIPTLQREHAKNIEGNLEVRDNINAGATIYFAFTVGKLLKELQSVRLHQLFLLNISLRSVHYHWPKPTFAEILTMENFNMFLQHLEGLWKDFQTHEEKGNTKLEAYLIHTLLTSGYLDKGEQSSEEAFSNIMTEFVPVLSPQLHTVLKMYATHSPFDWTEMTGVIGELANDNIEADNERKVDTCSCSDKEAITFHDRQVQQREPFKPCKIVVPAHQEAHTSRNRKEAHGPQVKPRKSAVPVKVSVKHEAPTCQNKQKPRLGPAKPRKPEISVKHGAPTCQNKQKPRLGPVKPLKPEISVKHGAPTCQNKQKPRLGPVKPRKPEISVKHGAPTRQNKQNPRLGPAKPRKPELSVKNGAPTRPNKQKSQLGPAKPRKPEISVKHGATTRQNKQKPRLGPAKPRKPEISVKYGAPTCHIKQTPQLGRAKPRKPELSIKHETPTCQNKQKPQLGPAKPRKPEVPVKHKAPTCQNKQKPQQVPIKPPKPELSVNQEAPTCQNEPKPQPGPSKPFKHVFPVQQQEPSISKNSPESERGPIPGEPAVTAFEEILTILDLHKYFPCKISILDVMVIKKATRHPELVDLPLLIIQKLFLIDFRARDEVWSLIKASETGNIHDGDNKFDLEDFLDLEANPNEDTNNICNNKYAAKLSTLDVLVSIFTCCDNMLKQMLAEKLFLCKLAIPFLYPQGPESNIVMSLWALRTITVQWHTKHNEITETQVTENPFPIVSFVRFGRPPMSKSKLMNDILSDNSHDTFFHHDCKNGAIPRRLTDGLVECSWFVTADKENEHLPCTTMFLNLRGDASLMEIQMKVLQNISSVVFVIITFEDLAKIQNSEACKQICHSGAKLILLLISGKDKQERKACLDVVGEDFLKSVRYILSTRHGSQKNASDLKTEARRQLSEAIAMSSGMVLNECAQLAAKKGIVVDECDDSACLEGRELAKKVLSHVEDKRMIDCKSTLLPLQGKEWLKYCELKKKQHRVSAKGTQSTSAYEADQVQQQMDDLRKKQAEIGDINRLTPFVKDFISTLQENKDVVLLYFLKWMNMFLDEKARATLPSLRKTYNTLWGKFQEAKKKQTEADMNKLKLEVDDAEHQLASASFGLENLFRELGQLYEALKESRRSRKDTKLAVEYLPEIAAKLLTKGIPLELIDGDASSVPISWVKAVLKNLGNIIGERRLFVLSVLGIQSSGKSTLLNTMFGLKLAVSAGRCTRGAYMQLIPVDDKAGLPFDYIVVVDTEGLRAPELGQLKLEHDNELATLVIGLGDVTIVNIKGENTAEVKDTLQIAVHAFLRMKLVSKHMEDRRSCIFIHQNVPAANAKVLMMQGCQKLQEDLDDMVKEAAQSEKMANINHFAQIINFDVQKHVWYFSDLWNGDPPMAPANPGYSEKISAVKQSLLRDIIKEKTTFLTASDLSLRIEDLWNGVLADDFVFSFRNSLEMKAYTGLQSKYYNLEWELQKSLKCWLQKAEIKVKRSETIEELDSSFDSQVLELYKLLTERAEEIKSCLNDYFESNNLKDITIQWQQSKLNQLEFAIQQNQNQARADLVSIKESRRMDVMQMQKWTEHETHIMKRAVELAKTLKGEEVTDSEMQSQFDSMWIPMVDEIASKSAENELQMDALMETILFERLGTHRSFLHDEISRTPLHIPPNCEFLESSITEEIILEEHICLKDTWRHKLKEFGSKIGFTKDPESQAKYRTVELTETILQEISAQLQKLSIHDTKSLRSHATEVIQKLLMKFDEYNKYALTSEKYTFTILPAYYIKLAVHISRYCVKLFNSIQHEYIKKHGVKAKLADYKNTAWSFFKNMVKQSTEEEMAGDLLCTQLKGAIYEVVKLKIPQQCVEEVLRDFHMTKYYLIVKIMDDLACKENFDDYASYIRNAKEFALRWVTKYTNEKIFSTNSGSSLSRYGETASIYIAKIIDCVKKSVEHATNEVEGQENEMMALWIDCFCKSVSQEIAVPVSTLKLVSSREVRNFNNLRRIVQDQLDTDVQASLVNNFECETEDSINWEGKSPSMQIMGKIWGCPEQCPFCKEPCVDTTDNHYSSSGKSHMCVQHRPKGVGGTHWHKEGVFEGVKHFKDQLETKSCMYSVQCKNLSFRCWKCTNKSEDDVWHKYIVYKTCMKDWDIAPDPTNGVSKYWMWFMATYKHELKDLYELQLPVIPESWNSITKQEALDDLRKYHN